VADAAVGRPSHLVLVGLPGSGKTTVAPILAALIGRAALDFDAELVRREGMEVAEIFARRGEEHFRALEHALTADLRHEAAMVLAPGGGWLGRAETVALLRPPATLVYLRVSPSVALRRMGATVAERPLLTPPDPLGALQRLLRARASQYEAADLVVDVDLLAPEEVAIAVATRWKLGQAGPAGEVDSDG
jgi:shikimate kinase